MKVMLRKEDESPKEAKDVAYWERNMLALWYAYTVNRLANHDLGRDDVCGWYLHGEWEGWSRVISLNDGKVTFHVPDDFDLGDLPQIEPNWDGHSTEEKWLNIMRLCGCKIPDESQAYGNDCRGGCET